MLEKRIERSFQVLESVNAINVNIATVIVDGDIEVSRSNAAVSFGKTQRSLFVERFPDATAYADLAGLVSAETTSSE